MATFNGFWEIKVEGTSKAVNSICEAIKNLEPECMIEKKCNVIRVWETYKVCDVDDASEFAIMVARVADSASFAMEGSIECSASAERMLFAIELNNGELAIRNTDWLFVSDPSCLEDYETYEEYCEECYEISNEEDFQMIKDNEETYCVEGKIYVEIPYGESIKIEY